MRKSHTCDYHFVFLSDLLAQDPPPPPPTYKRKNKNQASPQTANTHSFTQVTAKDVALEDGVFCTVTMAAGESEALPLCTVWRPSSAEQNSMDAEAGNITIICRI